MKLPEVKNADKYVGLYIVDFGDHCGVGFTPEEVAELLDSVTFADIKVYKIYRAYPDGRMELKGVVSETFQLEKGLFFYASDKDTATDDYRRLVALAVAEAPPGRAKLHLAKHDDSRYVTALIYPAEYDDQFSRWLLDAGYTTQGETIGGADAVRAYYQDAPDILDRCQLWGPFAFQHKTGDDLLAATKLAVLR